MKFQCGTPDILQINISVLIARTLPWIVAMRLRSILSFKDSSFGPIIARISSSSREWFRAESKLPAEALRRDDESSGDRLRRDTLSRLDARRPSDSSRSCWVLVLLFGGNGGGVPEELFSSDKHTFVLQGIECVYVELPTTNNLLFSFL